MEEEVPTIVNKNRKSLKCLHCDEGGNEAELGGDRSSELVGIQVTESNGWLIHPYAQGRVKSLQIIQ